VDAHAALIDLIRLARTDGIGAKTLRTLLERFGHPSEVIAHQQTWNKRAAAITTIAVAEKEFAGAAKRGFTYVCWGDTRYPEPLRAIEDAPPLLVVNGDAAVLATPMLAIVGARNATLNGRKFAKQLAVDLARAGFTIISGLARGIDAAAHDGALSAGKTVAVLAGGTDVIYPPEHDGLYDMIAQGGAVISEMPPGTTPHAALFPRRNRIISGASRGVIVVEATPRSGSLITARLAAEQGRDVFAVPGSPLDPRAQGPNGLIRDGATLVQCADDVLSAIGPLTQNFSARAPALSQPIEIASESHISAVRREIEAALGATPAAVDELVRQCQVSPAVVATILLELELAGRLERLPGNRVALIGTV
jgi:DNA processing protein